MLPVLEWVTLPEYRPATADLPSRMLLSRDSPDWWRIRYQIAHEVFHWLMLAAADVPVDALAACGRDSGAGGPDRRARLRSSRV